MRPRTTKLQQLVVLIFQNTGIPLSLQQIFQEVRTTYPTTAYSTVFRIVQRLVSEKKLLQVDWRQRGSFYEWAEREHHHHLVCTNCGEVTDVDDQVVGFNHKRITHTTGFTINAHSIEIRGVCPPCQSTTTGKTL